MFTIISELPKRISQVIDKDGMGKKEVSEVEKEETCLF